MLFIAFVVVALSIPFCMVLHKVNKWTGCAAGWPLGASGAQGALSRPNATPPNRMVDGIGKLPSPLPAAWGRCPVMHTPVACTAVTRYES
jgi:hypothetical protein